MAFLGVSNCEKPLKEINAKNIKAKARFIMQLFRL
jgi:hypothetical protein